MSIEITVSGGTAKRLLTGGKYCADDILVTATGTELPELSDPGTAADLMEGKELLDGSGEKVVGTFTLAQELEEQDALLGQIAAALAGKVGGGAEPDPTAGYQRVAYITAAEAETYPYFITDFCADNESGVEIIASFPSLVDRIPMGSREDSGSTRFYCVYPLSASSVYYGFNTGTTISCKLQVDTVYRLQTNFLNSRLVNVYTEDGERKASSSISETLTAHSAPVAIFGYNSAASGAVTSKREYVLYGARCSRGHEVVREYIPCVRKSDGVVGVFEKFTGTFLENGDPEGSAFAAGPEIDW